MAQNIFKSGIMKVIMHFVFLPPILALGMLTSRGDIREGKIRNFHVSMGIGLSIFINFALFLMGHIGSDQIIRTLIYTTIAFILGIALWLMGYWSEGDAKLYAAFTALLPPIVYAYSAVSFPPLDILMNAIIPVFLYLLLILLIKTSAKQKVEVLKDSVNLRRILSTLFLIFSTTWLIKYLLVWLNLPEHIFFYIILIAGSMKLISFIFKDQGSAFLIALALARLILNREYILSMPFLRQFFLITAGYLMVMIFVSNLGEYFTLPTPLHALKPGMVVSAAGNGRVTRNILRSLTKNDIGGVEGASQIGCDGNRRADHPPSTIPLSRSSSHHCVQRKLCQLSPRNPLNI